MMKNKLAKRFERNVAELILLTMITIILLSS